MSKTKLAVGYRWIVEDRSQRLFGLNGNVIVGATLELRVGTIENAATKYERSGDDYDLDWLRVVRESTHRRDATYFYDGSDHQLNLRFQCDDENTGSGWYGMRIDHGKVSKPVSRLLGRIVKALEDNWWNQQPKHLVRALNARAIRYPDGSCLSRWLWDDEATLAQLETPFVHGPFPRG